MDDNIYVLFYNYNQLFYILCLLRNNRACIIMCFVITGFDMSNNSNAKNANTILLFFLE